MSTKKDRLDKYLFERGYFDTKSKASAAILAGDVKINDEFITKAGFQIDPEKKLEIAIKSMPYVSRGGFKLEKALKTFDINVKDRIAFDAGASTGGFTDCLLQSGTKYIYAVDVGYGQLAWKIRSDNKVKVVERTNIKSCRFEDIYTENEPIADLLVMDVSFISIEKVLPNLKKLLKPEFHEAICLIKPQFEAGKEIVDKGNGVIRDKDAHIDVINNVIGFVKNLNYEILGLTFSSIKGPSGNIEYLIHFSTKGDSIDADIQAVVDDAFATLNA